MSAESYPCRGRLPHEGIATRVHREQGGDRDRKIRVAKRALAGDDNRFLAALRSGSNLRSAHSCYATNLNPTTAK